MKKIFMLLLLLSFAFSLETDSLIDTGSINRECSDIDNPEECEALDFCEWLSETPDSADGMCVEFNDDWWDNECSGLTQDECTENEYCDWSIITTPNGVFEMCIEADDGGWENQCSGLGYEECEALDFCEWLSDTPDTADGMCVEFNDDWWNNECSGLGYEECETLDFCEWLSDTPDSTNGMCVEFNDDWNDDCDPDLACATVITCYEGLLYPTSCGPENCDDPIGECDDYYEGCQSDNGQWYDIGHEMFINDCEYYECTENGWEGPFTLDNDDCSNNNWGCSDLGYEDCQAVDYCEWISDSDNPNSWGSCVEVGNDNDGPPDCLMDCEGIEDINPSEDPYEVCDWIISNFGLNNFFNECADDCDEETLMEINEFVEVCYECLVDNNCEDIFDDNYDGCQSEAGEWYCFGCELFINECEYYECTEGGWEGPFELDDCMDNNECSELNYPDCIENEECEWIITNEWGGYSCVEIEICEDLDYNECIEADGCQPNYNAAGEFESCEEINNQPNFGYLYGTVSYIYGDVVDFVPYASIHIESVPSNSDMFYFETMTNGDGYYQIELPPGFYMVTAYVNEESLTHDVQIAPNSENELNFLIGDGYGPWDPFAILDLGSSQAVPGDDVVIPLYLSSTEFVGGVQFTIGTNMEGALTPIGIESMDPCFSADYNVIDEGQLIGIIFSFEGCTYSPGEMLQIVDLIFNVSNEVSFGDEVEMFFNNTIVSDSVGNEISSYGNGGVVLIGAQGDINADGDLNVLDVVMMVNFALYTEEPSDSEFWASDLNDDGAINVLDIVQLVNLILNN